METRTEERPTDDVDRDKPCRIDPRCYRFQGHEGEHLYGDPPRPALHRGEGMTDTDRLDALAAAATPGPWEARGAFVDQGPLGRTVAETDLVADGPSRYPDAEFIAACDPATIRDLLAAVRERGELRAALEASVKALGSFLWLGNNLHNAGTDIFREMYQAALTDARTAYEAGAALHHEDGAS